MDENTGLQLPSVDICESLFGSSISANIMLSLLRKLDLDIAADKHRMGANTASLPASYKAWATLSVGMLKTQVLVYIIIGRGTFFIIM